MTDEGQLEGLNHYRCQYGGSRVQFRGPAVPLDAPYTAIIGGCEVYGRYVEDPFTDQLAELTCRRVVNMGVMNAGIDVFAADPDLLTVLSKAEAVVVQVTGLHNISNRYYTVHPRRNDRFLEASGLLTALYRDVDFSEFSFTRHMLVTLQHIDSERFEYVANEISQAWTARMCLLLSRIPGQKILLLLSKGADRGLGREPAFATEETILGLKGAYDRILRCDITTPHNEDHFKNMVFADAERASASQMLSVEAHRRIAIALADTIRETNHLAA